MSGPSKKDWLICLGILAAIAVAPAVYGLASGERGKRECNSLKERYLMARSMISLQKGIVYGRDPVAELDASTDYRDARSALIDRCGLNAPYEAERHLNETGSLSIN